MSGHARWGSVVLCLALTACNLGGGRNSTANDGGTNGIGDARYDVTITRTRLGIPHLKANDFGSIGYGYGYAFAEDNLCVMQEDFVTIRGERSRYFGRDGTYTIVPNGVTASNIDSDYFWKFAADDQAISPARDNTEPKFKDVTHGFVEGYNRYIRELQSGQHGGRHMACRDADWLFEIEDDDMYRRFFRLAVIASSSVLLNEIANAEPLLAVPVADAPTAVQKRQALAADPGPFRYFTELQGKRFGSNMYALGKDVTRDGSSMVWGNPHFPWTGTERLYMAHATIPGEMDIMGSSLYGVPAILIGFNDHLAWSHTVSTAYRFTMYELTLNPANPFQYVYGTGFRDIEQVPVTIDIKEPDGSLSQETRTLYRSHYGPMFVLEASGLPVLGWTTAKAYTLRDANAENDRLINQFAGWNTAKDLEEFTRLHGEILGIPWVNTVASGPGGKAYYGDLSVVPNVPDSKVETCQALPIHQVVQQLVPGLPVLNGALPDCEWDSDVDAPVPGIFGRSNLPKLFRDDWVGNNNDSYWLTNPEAPITGFARIIGDEGTERSFRTRQAIVQLQERLDGSDGLGEPGFTIPLLQEMGLSSAIYTARIGLDNVLSELCPSQTGDEAAACTALAQWDGTANRDSIGAHVWREFWVSLNPGVKGGDYWRVPYDPADPVNTPRDLDATATAVQDAFSAGVARVAASGFAFDAALGDIQHPCCIQDDIPLFGGQFFEGAFTIADSADLSEAGYEVEFGNSYIHSVTWDEGGVDAWAFVTYSQSTDPANPHFSDFTREYSNKRWNKMPFHEDEIAADAISQIRLTN